MQIWSSEIKELESLYTSIKGRFPELEKDLEHLIKTDDENVALLYSRRCLEIIVTDLCECELKRPRKTEPLKGIIEKLHHEEKIPAHIITSVHGLNDLATYGAHPKDFDPEQIKPVLNNLVIIIKWYGKYKDTQTISYAKAEEVKNEGKQTVAFKEGTRKPKKRLIFLISGIVLTVGIVVVALFVFNTIGVEKQTKEHEKSIAVLPFIDDSKNEENTAFINGLMDEVVINLQTIKDLSVPGRTSVEQYRNNVTKSIPEIARELGVNYIVEGSGQKYGNTVVLRIQLLEGPKDKHLWGASYEQKIDNIEDIIEIQSQIAQSIADELKAIITPEEKQLIQKTPTTSLTAYDFFQRGREEHWKYWLEGDHEALDKAEDLYHDALKYDSTYAQAYTGLAYAYWNKHYWRDIYSEDFMDSVIILCDIALSYDEQLSEAYIIRGQYFFETGNGEQAIKECNKAIKFNPNDWMAYWQLSSYYSTDDIIKCIDNFNKAIFLNRGEQLPELLDNLGEVYCDAGFTEKAEYYLSEQIIYCNRMKELGRTNGFNADIFYDLAAAYAFNGDKDKAFENLRSYNNCLRIISSWALSDIRHDPLFDPIRDEPEFQHIVRDMDAKYQAEHERVKKWLEENGILE